MQVTVRDTIHAESPRGWLSPRTVTVEISDRCPVCGGLRGVPQRGLTYDGSVRLHVDTWSNPCGHVDTHVAVCAEAKAIADDITAAA